MFETRKISIGNHKIMTYSAGFADNTLLLLHGGPSSRSNYLRESHQVFTQHGFRVVTWDQLGCGESDRPTDNKSLWQISRFVEEVETVRSSLDLGKVHLFGHSWGGILGLEYCINYPQNIKTFIPANTAFDLPRMQRGFERKKLALGEETYTMMARREADGTMKHPEYQAALTLLLRRHLCRAEVWTEALEYELHPDEKHARHEMFGPYPFNCTGNIRDYNRMDQLESIAVPTLIIHSEHDYIVPDLASMARDRLPNAELAMFKNCSHLPFYEEPEIYQKTLLAFLNNHT